MFFNLFGGNKESGKEEIDKKYKLSVAPPSPTTTNLNSQTEDEIDIVLGDNIKKSKYTVDLSDNV